MKCSLGISNFLDKISSFSHSIVFLYLFALITEEGFLISPCYSLELSIKFGISFLFSFAFCFFSLHSYLQSLLTQPFCFFAYFFLRQGRGKLTSLKTTVSLSSSTVYKPGLVSPRLNCYNFRVLVLLKPF